MIDRKNVLNYFKLIENIILKKKFESDIILLKNLYEIEKITRFFNFKVKPKRKLTDTKLNITKANDDFFYLNNRRRKLCKYEKNLFTTKGVINYEVMVYSKNKYFSLNCDKLLISKYILKKSNFDFRDLVSEMITKDLLLYKINELIFKFMKCDPIIKSIGIALRSLASLVNIRIDLTILEYILKRAFIFDGICYQTIDYIAKSLQRDRSSVMNNIRKLEFLGIIDYVVADRENRNNSVKNTLNIIEGNILDDEMLIGFNSLRETEKPIYFRRYEKLLFPAIDFKTLLNYTCKINLGDSFYNYLKFFVDSKNKKIKDLNNLRFNKDTNKLNLMDLFFQHYNGLHNSSNIFNYCYSLDGKNCIDYLYSKKNKYDGENLIFIDILESIYSVNYWIKKFFKDFYFKIVGKKINRIFIKKFILFINDNYSEFEEYINEYDYSSLLNNVDDTELLKLVKIYLENVRLSTLKQCEYSLLKSNKLSEKINIFKPTNEFRELFNREYCWLNLNIVDKVNRLFDVVCRKYDISLSEFKNYPFQLFWLIKEVLIKIDDKLNFILLVYNSFVNKNKSIIGNFNNLINFLESLIIK